MHIYNGEGRKAFYQWDIDQKLTADGLAVDDEIHFANVTTPEALILKAYALEDGTVVVDVPNALLCVPYDLKVYRFIKRDDCGCRTKECYTFDVHKRPKPAGYVYTEPEALTVEEIVKREIKEAIENGEIGGITEEDAQKILKDATEYTDKTAAPRIDPDKVSNGDPTNPTSTYDVGTYAGIYSEYYGSDKKWRPRLLRANAAAYANLNEASVTKFADNLKTARIPITDSVGRLSVSAPQKGKNGEYHYYNPAASAATNNAYNCAVPLWYADERYIKSADKSSIVQEAKRYTDAEIEKVKTEIGGGGGKLYRHDICLSSWLERGADLWFSFYNADPTSYESHYVEDEETFEVIEQIDLTPLNAALGTANCAAYGYAGDYVVIGVNADAGSVDTVNLTVYSTNFEGYSSVETDHSWPMQDCYDTVTEITL